MDSSGSSPPVRGTRRRSDAGESFERFIPACAGNTSSQLYLLTSNPVHPRLCGEHILSAGAMEPPTGSSPPVRGTRFEALPAPLLARFIPACAGNTGRQTPSRQGATVHPRLCGEHLADGHIVFSYDGSSPPVRGTQHVAAYLRVNHRFIPACAGNTRIPPRTGCRLPVHPRLCGEHCWGRAARRRRFGSSPPVRGTPPIGLSSMLQWRFIPACAGNTLRRCSGGQYRPVHPRLCGEHCGNGNLKLLDNGSSPPVRGTQPQEVVHA